MEQTIIAGISAILLAFSVLYAARQMRLLRMQHQENHDWNRRLAAQQAVREYKELQEIVVVISEHFDYQNRTEAIPISDFQALFDKVPGLQSNLHTVINYFEGVARGVRQGIYDEEVIKVAFRGTMIEVYETFQYYIKKRRREFHNPRIWDKLEELSDQWKNETRHVDPERRKTGTNS